MCPHSGSSRQLDHPMLMERQPANASPVKPICCTSSSQPRTRSTRLAPSINPLIHHPFHAPVRKNGRLPRAGRCAESLVTDLLEVVGHHDVRTHLLNLA